MRRCPLTSHCCCALIREHHREQILQRNSVHTRKFASFEASTELVHKKTSYKSQTPGVHFICGGLAACSATVACQPLDTLHARFAAQGEPKGLSPSLLKAALSTGFTFFWYEFFINPIVSLKSS